MDLIVEQLKRLNHTLSQHQGVDSRPLLISTVPKYTRVKVYVLKYTWVKVQMFKSTHIILAITASPSCSCSTLVPATGMLYV